MNNNSLYLYFEKYLFFLNEKDVSKSKVVKRFIFFKTCNLLDRVFRSQRNFKMKFFKSIEVLCFKIPT